MSENINDLSGLLREHLSANEYIKSSSFTSLTAKGDNYGSVMLKVDVIISNNETKKERDLNLVAKTLPDTANYREIFNIQVTYKNEMAFYDLMVPSLRKFQKEAGVTVKDIFAKCYGTRKNLLQDSDVIDDDAVLLLENLKVQGYTNGDRKIGFDYETAKLILKDIAIFHASFLSFKLLKPDVFKKTVLPYCFNYEPVAADLKEIIEFFRKLFIEISKEDEDCLKLAPKVTFWGDVPRSKPREPFATLIHTDLWTNNTMQLFEGKKAIANKLVDFQIMTYGSPAADVFFFLWTSVPQSVLETNLDSLLKLYHTEFIQTLEDHGCNVSAFGYDKFLEEIRLEARSEFGHSIQFLSGVSFEEGLELPKLDLSKVAKNAPQHFKDRIYYMVKECNKRGWLY